MRAQLFITGEVEVRAPRARLILPLDFVFYLRWINGRAAQVAGPPLATAAEDLAVSLGRQMRGCPRATLFFFLWMRHLATTVGPINPLAAIVIPELGRVNPPVHTNVGLRLHPLQNNSLSPRS